jgi:CzcA family heavy metal efflux pump
MDENYHLYLTLVDDMYKTIDDIKNTVISTQNSTPIYLKDIATVTPSLKDEYIRVTGNGKPAVLINIIRQPNGNTVQIARDVKAELANLKSQIPSGISIKNFYDQSELVLGSFGSVRDSIGIGVLFAIIVLLIFLRNWRVTFVAAIIIPATVSITAALLMVTNQTLNMMTLGGIAAAIGLIIDDTIVIIENVFRHFKHGHEKMSHAISASIKEMLPAVLGSSSSTIIIFLPFAFLGGVTGAFFKSLSLTMALALIVSLVLSLLFAPLLASKIIHEKDFLKEAKSESSGKILTLYKKLLSFLVERRLIVLPIIILLLVSSYYIYLHLGSEFMPKMDEGAFVMDYVAPFGTSLNETNRMLMQVEKIIMSIPEVDTYSRRTGTQMGFFITEPNSGDYLIKLKANRKRSIDEVINELRQKVEASEPALQIDFGQAMQDLIGDLTSVPSPIEIKVFGENKEIMQAEAKKIANLISNVRGVVDVFNGITISGPAYIIKVNQEAAGRAGFSVSNLQQIIYNFVHGEIPTSVQSGEKLIGIRIRYPDVYRNNIEKLKTVRIISPNGGSFMLGSLADISVDPGQSEINRENLKQMVAVTARISGRDLGSTIGAIKNELNKNLVLPQGVSISYGGIYKTQQESFYGLLMVLLAASLLVILVLIIEFESFFLPFTIYLVALLSLFGVFLALWITKISFSITSFMGAIMMVGIVAENSIFLVHYFLKFQKEGMPLKEAIIEAGAVRFRPIIMTALAAILALMPLALGIGAGAQMQQPLAIAVIGGFSLSSLLLLFILPVLIAKYKK